MNPSPIFVVGVYRSGTTLLRSMLNAHPQIQIPVESHFLVPLINQYHHQETLNDQQVQAICDSILDHKRFDPWKTKPEELRQAVTELAAPTLGAIIEVLFRLETDTTGKPNIRWGDKTPSYMQHVKRLAEVFPTAQFIHIVRDGRDVSNSLRDRGWKGATEFQRAKYWAKCVATAESDGAELGSQRFLQVRYEDLVDNVEQQLQCVCDFLNLEYEASMLDYSDAARAQVVSQELHTKLSRLPEPKQDSQRWRRESSHVRVLCFEAVAGRWLERCRYSRKFPRWVAMLATLFCQPLGWAADLLHRLYLLVPVGIRSGLRQNGMFHALRTGIYGRRKPSTATGQGDEQ